MGHDSPGLVEQIHPMRIRHNRWAGQMNLLESHQPFVSIKFKADINSPESRVYTTVANSCDRNLYAKGSRNVTASQQNSLSGKGP